MQTVEAMQVIQLLERCEGLGVGASALCDAVGLSREQLTDPDARMPFDTVPRLLAAAEGLTQDPLIALRAGASRPPRGLLVYQARAQDSFKDALAQLSQNARLAASPLRFEVREGTRQASLCLFVDAPESEPLALVREYVTGFLVRFLAELAPSFRARELRFPDAPRAPIEAYERVLAAPVRFHQRECAIVIAPDLLAAPIATANAVVARLFEDQIEHRLAVRRSGDYRADVELAMEALLRDRRSPERSLVARRLGVSVRTLQRRLGAEGCTFRSVREAVLRREAAPLIARRSLPLSDVAQRLGFADADAFAKAWKRWTGEPPSEQRRRS
ncbi:MAG TPA: AraC family transcriptional regulator ligand-binding domain-containing protein [Myxococcota bacterium]|nr:AraC family transcriptional regulator ligand-binding domain-containing protein [Myxococcota bacterium]